MHVSPPITGRLEFSERDTTVGSPTRLRTSMSRKPLWGATANTGASFCVACRPLTFIQRKPMEKNTDRLKKHMIGWKNQCLQPWTGFALSSCDRPASRSRATAHISRKERMARVMRTGKNTQPSMTFCEEKGWVTQEYMVFFADLRTARISWFWDGQVVQMLGHSTVYSTLQPRRRNFIYFFFLKHRMVLYTVDMNVCILYAMWLGK